MRIARANVKDFGARRNFSAVGATYTRGANYLIKRFHVSRPSAFRGATKYSRNNCDVIHTLTMRPAPDRESRCGCGVAVVAATAARRLIFQIQKVVPWGDKKQRRRGAAYTSITRSRREIAPCAATRKRSASRSTRGSASSVTRPNECRSLCGITWRPICTGRP